jgi:integrase
LVRDAALVVFMFLFGCRASTAVTLRSSDVDVSADTVTVVLVNRKGKRTQDPLVLTYERNPAIEFSASPLAVLRRWSDMRPTSDEHFALAEEEALSPQVATHAVASLLSALHLCAPAGCVFSSHSVRIGAFNEWLSLAFPTPWIMHRMGWESMGMLQVYYDPRITVTDDSIWFFGHMRPHQ